MRILYLDCRMGAAGDMVTAALCELLPEDERAKLVERVNALGIPGVRAELERSVKCGITGSHMRVTVGGVDEEAHHAHPHEHEHMHEHEHEHMHEHEHEHEHMHHHHHSLADMWAVIDALDVPDAVKERTKAVYSAIARAEGEVHGREPGEVHFHEVGAMDAVADVVTVSLLMDMLAPERVICSPVRTGFGTVKCAHGILPVPAPATALLLRGIPVFAGDVPGEMTTPTGAALLGNIADEFGEMPAMVIESVGYGMGSRDFPTTNCVRAFLGESAEKKPEHEVAELFCTLDDATGEEIGFARELLLSAGALDVYTASVNMKKGRPGVLISCLCDYDRREEFARLILRHTTTLGVRIYTPERMKLSRSIEKVETPWGSVRIKRSSGYDIEKSKAEYDDLARIARETDRPIAELRREIEKLK